MINLLAFCTVWQKNISQPNPFCWHLAWRSEHSQTQLRVSPGVYERRSRPNIYKPESPPAVKSPPPSLTETNTLWWVSRGPSLGNHWRWAPCRLVWREPGRWGAAPSAWRAWQGWWHHDWTGSGHRPEVVCSVDQCQWLCRTVTRDLGCKKTF